MEVAIFFVIIAIIIVGISRTWGAPNDRYCTRCGEEKTATVQFEHFDGKTGKKVTYTVRACPNEERLFKSIGNDNRDLRTPD